MSFISGERNYALYFMGKTEKPVKRWVQFHFFPFHAVYKDHGPIILEEKYESY